MRGIKRIFAKSRVHVAAYSVIFNLGFSFAVGLHGLIYHHGEPGSWDAIALLMIPPTVVALCMWLPGEAEE